MSAIVYYSYDQFFITIALMLLRQRFYNFWCNGALEEVDFYLRSPTIDF